MQINYTLMHTRIPQSVDAMCLDFLLVALVVVCVGVLLDTIRTISGVLIRDRPHGLRHLLAWALTDMLVETIAPHTLFADITKIFVPLVFIAWFFWNYYYWLKCRNPSPEQQFTILRKSLRIFVRAQLTPHAFLGNLKRWSNLLGRACRAVKIT